MNDFDNFFNLGNENFSLECKKCTFRLEKILKTDGLTHNVLTVYPLNTESVNYAFSGSQGLCSTTPHGSLHNKNLLGTLISLQGKNPKKVLHFFEEQGYLLPIASEV